MPGGPYTRMFLYRLWFFLVFLVAMAMSRTRASRLGCQGTRQVGGDSAASVLLLSTRTSPKASSSQAFCCRREKRPQPVGALCGQTGASHPKAYHSPGMGGATYAEDDALQCVLRLTEEPPADLLGGMGDKTQGQ